MHPLIEEIYRTQVVRDADGNTYPLDSQVDPVEGSFLRQLIESDPSIVKTLEVGCAYGVSSLHICDALRGREGASHTMVDPNEMSDWHGVGVQNLTRAGIDFFRLMEEPSELALPELLRRGETDFDLIFIDGWHTFDATLVDLFYAIRLLRVGGIVVVDDCDRTPVAKAVAYVLRYPCMEQITSDAPPASSTSQGRMARAALPPEAARTILPARLFDAHYVKRRFSAMVGLRKVSEDRRDWEWYRGF